MSAGVHAMPFGAEPAPDGGVRFSLYAPAAKRIDLILIGSDGAERSVRMPATREGWFGLEIDKAGAGTRYRYVVDGELAVPDPASRSQPLGVHGPSEVVDAAAYAWQSVPPSRPWAETVLYELHVGTFTAQGTFDSAIDRLDHLCATGVTAVEVMPVACFAGQRNWGYDGVLPYAPHATYGGAEGFRRFVDAAHQRGMSVLLDVVYNHFGPEGNYLHAYAPTFFTSSVQTPWGDAINYDGEDSRSVRDFFLHNALYWLTEFQLDGLRLDAVHAIVDGSSPDILTEIADAVHSGPGRERAIHLVLENERNQSRYLSPDTDRAYRAQWNDDFHHAAHALATGESDGYYADYADRAPALLARCLAEGFAFQGDRSAYRGGERRGEPSANVASTAFIDFLQNHDQIGNRAVGDRLTTLAPRERLRSLTTILLLAPCVPALFMGEEFACRQPFLYFADFDGELADAVRSGRRREFSRFEAFGGSVPDPMADDTFETSRLDWSILEQPAHAEWLAFVRELIALRHERIVPRLPAVAGSARTLGGDAFEVSWQLGDGELVLFANVGDTPIDPVGAATDWDPGMFRRLLRAEPDGAVTTLLERGTLEPWSVIFMFDDTSPA